MTHIKRIVLAAMSVLPFLSYATDFPWLTFSLSDGTELSVAAENLTINYDEGNLLLSSKTVSQVLPTNTIKSMKFTSYSAGINDINGSSDVEADYYNVSGVKVGTFSSVEDARKVLPSGTYIWKSGIKTNKVIF